MAGFELRIATSLSAASLLICGLVSSANAQTAYTATMDARSVCIVASSRTDDLAALQTDSPNDNTLKLRLGFPIKVAEKVLVFGYPLAGALSSGGNTTLGNVTALTGLRDDSRFLQVSASIQPGNSGGPVLDEMGRLIGVIEGKLDALKFARRTGDVPQNVNFAIRASTLATFLEVNGLGFEAAENSAILPSTRLAELAQRASAQIECLK